MYHRGRQYFQRVDFSRQINHSERFVCEIIPMVTDSFMESHRDVLEPSLNS